MGRSSDFQWERTGGETAGRAGRWQGPRWIVPVRSLVVVLAMVAAALGVLWIESAGVQNASAQLAAESAGKVTVPPLDASAGTGPSGGAGPSGPAGTGPPSGAGPPGTTAPSASPAPSNGTVPGGSGPATPGATAGEGLVVHVTGAVKHPGVFLLGQGSRVFQAVDAAGGALPAAELGALNLAAPLSDGLQVFVPTREQAAKMLPNPGTVLQPGQGPGGPGNSQSGGQGLLNLNTATVAELDTLPGVGPVLAERIVQWRTDHGPFATVDALDAVSGIGAKLLAGLRDLVSVS